jgi:hypothetical protein
MTNMAPYVATKAVPPWSHWWLMMTQHPDRRHEHGKHNSKKGKVVFVGEHQRQTRGEAREIVGQADRTNAEAAHRPIVPRRPCGR